MNKNQKRWKYKQKDKQTTQILPMLPHHQIPHLIS